MGVIRAVAIGVAGLIAAGATSVAPASADVILTSEAGPYHGRVTATSSLTVRTAPSSYAASQGSLAKGKKIAITCKLRGTTVGGNNVWYRIENTKWVSARYVATVGPSPRWCTTSYPFAGVVTTESLTVRVGPTTKDKLVSTVLQHNDVHVSCKVISQSVGGTNLWYQIGSGKWVSAAYVHNYDEAPAWCRP